MPSLNSRITTEGQLIAHREILAFLLAQLPDRANARQFLDAQTIQQTGEEDPGAVPDPAFAAFAAVGEELQLVKAAMDRAGQDIRGGVTPGTLDNPERW